MPAHDRARRRDGARRHFRAAALALAVAAGLCGHAGSSRAQDFSLQPVKLIVPLTLGGSNDVLARVVPDKLAAVWQQTENRPGASSNIGAEAVARSPADGYTLLAGGSRNQD